MVIWSIPARNDLKQIYDYIAKDSRYYATNVVENIISKAENLDEFPEIGRVVPEIGDENVRELFICMDLRLNLIKGKNGRFLSKKLQSVPRKNIFH